MKIICVRHGEACNPEINPQRPLTERGQEQVNQLAAFLAKSGLSVQQIFHSGKLRAQQTAELFAKALFVNSLSELPLLEDEQAGVAHLLELIPFWTENTMIVGHLPFLPQLINALVLGHPNYFPIIHCPPATVTCLEYQDDERWIIRWLLNPELLTK